MEFERSSSSLSGNKGGAGITLTFTRKIAEVKTSLTLPALSLERWNKRNEISSPKVKGGSWGVSSPSPQRRRWATKNSPLSAATKEMRSRGAVDSGGCLSLLLLQRQTTGTSRLAHARSRPSAAPPCLPNPHAHLRVAPHASDSWWNQFLHFQDHEIQQRRPRPFHAPRVFPSSVDASFPSSLVRLWSGLGGFNRFTGRSELGAALFEERDLLVQGSRAFPPGAAVTPNTFPHPPTQPVHKDDASKAALSRFVDGAQTRRAERELSSTADAEKASNSHFLVFILSHLELAVSSHPFSSPSICGSTFGFSSLIPTLKEGAHSFRGRRRKFYLSVFKLCFREAAVIEEGPGQ